MGISQKLRSNSPPTARDLVRDFNLTHTEAEVALELAAGLSAAEISAARGTSVHTVRTHLKRALIKTGTHTQAALVGKLYRGAEPRGESG